MRTQPPVFLSLLLKAIWTLRLAFLVQLLVVVSSIDARLLLTRPLQLLRAFKLAVNLELQLRLPY